MAETRGSGRLASLRSLTWDQKEAVEEMIAESGRRGIELNFKAVSFGSVAGLRALASAWRSERLTLIIDGVSALTEADRACVAVGNALVYQSSGFLISGNVVVTAGHVIRGAKRVSVEDNVTHSRGGYWVRSCAQYPHQDVGLLFLEEPIEGINPFPILETRLSKNVHVGTAMGYGARDASTLTGYGSRMKTGLPIPIHHDVIPRKGRFNSETEIFADDPLTLTDACIGDSGGPLLVKSGDEEVVAGVVSRRGAGRVGASCGQGTVYVRLDPFVDWIDDKIAENKGMPRGEKVANGNG